MSDGREEDSYLPVGSAGHPRPRMDKDGTPVRTGAVISKEMTINGQVKSQEDMYVDGDVQGTLELQGCSLTIGPHGRVGADTKAREIVVLGAIDGDVEATEKITIRKGGKLIGDIRTAGIIIEDGAYFKGSIDIVLRQGETAAARRETANSETPVIRP